MSSTIDEIWYGKSVGTFKRISAITVDDKDTQDITSWYIHMYLHYWRYRSNIAIDIDLLRRTVTNSPNDYDDYHRTRVSNFQIPTHSISCLLWRLVQQISRNHCWDRKLLSPLRVPFLQQTFEEKNTRTKHFSIHTQGKILFYLRKGSWYHK